MTVVGIACTILVVLCLLFVRPFITPTDSMAPTIPVNSRIVGIATYGMKCSIGDIVIFEKDGTTFVRRIVATGGDEVSITDGKLFVNDKESSVQGDGMDADGMFSDSKWTLEDDEYFVLGDNLKNAEDSRYIGPIKASEVIARFVFSF